MGALADRPPVSWKQGWTITAVFALAYGAVLVSASLLSPSGLEAQGPVTTPVLPPLKHIIRDASAWLASWAPLSDMPKTERLALLLEENEWKNSLVMWMFPEQARQAMPHFVQTWVRCIVLCAAVYFIVGLVWCYYAYYCFGDKLFKPGTIPALGDVLEQIKVSCSSIPLYSLLPAITEYMAENGWTMAYPRVDNVGIPMYAVYFVLYMTSVEFGVYWMHRGLHEVKIGYKLLHAIHHKYNKEHTLSPFAGLAFHPLDGVMQAIPYTWTMLFCPMHFLTHEMLLFATGVWTANIHDCIHGKVWPIMGAGYHTIHHTTYKHNYGHYFTFMDQLFGTLYTPEEEEEEKQVEQNAVAIPAPAVRHADATAHVVSSTSYNTRSRKSAKADA